MSLTLMPDRVLLAEDNPADVMLMREAMQISGWDSQLDVVGDGMECMQYLNREPPYETAKKPDLLILDLNMPRMGGLEVVKEVRADARLQDLVIAVLTTSLSPDDIDSAKDYGADCYIPKPMHVDGFLADLQEVLDFWVKNVRLGGRR